MPTSSQPIEFPDSPLHDRMIFLVGARRSGTNWLFRLLTTHPEVVGIPSETYLFALGLAPLRQEFHRALTAASTGDDSGSDSPELLRHFRDFADGAFIGIADRLDSRAARVLERTPWHAEHLDLIGAVYPDAWIVHIIRDGRDVVGSLTRQSWGPPTIDAAAEEWVSAVRLARAHAPVRYREVRYEELMADPVGGTAELVAWLGLPWSEELAEAVALEAGVPYNVDGSNPAIVEGKWRASLSDSDTIAFNAVAGELLRELGYPAVGASRRSMRAAVAPNRWSRSLRRLGPRRNPETPDRSAPDTDAAALSLADEVMAALEEASAERLRRVLKPDARIAVIGATAFERRGEQGLRRLVAEWIATQDERGRRVRYDVHVQGWGFTALVGYADAADVLRHCAVVVRADRDSTSPIRALVCHRLA